MVNKKTYYSDENDIGLRIDGSRPFLMNMKVAVDSIRQRKNLYAYEKDKPMLDKVVDALECEPYRSQVNDIIGFNEKEATKVILPSMQKYAESDKHLSKLDEDGKKLAALMLTTIAVNEMREDAIGDWMDQ